MLSSNLFSINSVIGFSLLVGAGIMLAAIPRFRRMPTRTLCAVAAGLLAFQLFHFLEHLIQLGYWFLHPTAKPYMTPWAVDGLEGLGLWASVLPGNGSMMMRGMELLHLVGNFFFLAGLLALGRLRDQHLPGLGLATKLQGVHLAEHVLLTATVFLVGSPLGLSTVFGLSEGTAWGGTVRVWFHFMINLAASIPAFIAWRHYRNEPNTRTRPTPTSHERALVAVTAEI